ncbi:MAG TPA: hypothetical protein VGH64_13305 [Puia sp.]|jgi:hypothetical protein
MRFFFALSLISIFNLPYAKAQDTLPGFTASLKSSGKVLISWRNGYPAINQISIQRSTDSLRNFTTLITVPDPQIPENGFVDNKPGSSKIYYRIFILFPNSKYMFTKSRRPVLERAEQPVTGAKQVHGAKPKIVQGQSKPKQSPPGPPVAQAATLETGKSTVTENTAVGGKADPVPPTIKPAEEEEKYLILPKIDNSRIYYMMDNSSMKRPSVTNPGKIKSPTIAVEKILYVKRRDSLIMQLEGYQVRRFSDSLVKQTKDTLYFVNADTLQIKPYVEVYREPKEVYRISPFVFTTKDGNISIALRDCKTKKYNVTFFEQDNTEVMNVKDINDTLLIIDKTNFGHAGWFRFELYEDGKLIEKNKLLIPREQ